MSILDADTGVQSNPVSLDDLIQTTPLPDSQPPLATIRNRAATTALLSGDPDNAVDHYQTMMQEGQQGSSATYNQLTSSIQQNTQKADLQGVMTTLSDSRVPLQQKQNILQGVTKSLYLQDSATTLHTNLLSAPSQGEGLDSEAARISSADALKQVYDTRTQLQGLANAHLASLHTPGIGEATSDFLALDVMPFGNAISTAKTKDGLDQETGDKPSVWQQIKGFFQPGSTVADIRSKLESLPPDQQLAYGKKIISAISQNSGIIYGNDNQYAQSTKLDSIFQDGGYDGFQKTVDNIAPILDIIGLGQIARDGLKGATSLGRDAVSEAAAAGRTAGNTATAVPPEAAYSGTRATAGRGNFGGGVSDVSPTSETQFADVTPINSTPPSNQLANPVPKLTSSGEPDLTTRVPGTGGPTPNPRTDIPNVMRQIETNVVKRVNPATPGEIANTANPEQARKIAYAAFADDSGEAANAFYGTSKDQAIVNNTMPNASVVPQIPTKVPDVNAEVRISQQGDPELVDFVNNDGGIYYTKGEKANARANIVNNFANADGLTMNEAMSSFALDGNGVHVKAVYGLPQGSFSNAQQAIDQAKFALRGYGVNEGDITVLQRNGLMHEPVEGIPSAQGDYLIQVGMRHPIDPTDISNFDKLDVKWNIFDRLNVGLGGGGKGGIQRNILDAGSMLHPTYTGSAAVNADKVASMDKFLLRRATDFSDEYSKLPRERQTKLDNYFKEANFNEIGFDHADLLARGFNSNEITAVAHWRNFWDNMYHLENADVIKSLNSTGHRMFKTPTTELYARPISKDRTLGKMYDPGTDSVRTFSDTEIDNLYNSGGTIAQLRRPTDFAGVTAEHMAVPNNSSMYLRRFRDTDRVLNYRQGYFQLSYKAPKFVDQVERDARGVVTSRKTVAVAGDTKQAAAFKDRMVASTGLNHEVRSDDRALARGSDEYFDLNTANGRVAQRHRGKLLEDASGINYLGDHSYIASPAESAIRAARSIAGRTVSRPMIEAGKARFMEQYAKFLPKDKFQQPRYPKTIGELGEKGMQGTKDLADARTTYAYLDFLENGYINSMDNGIKAMFHTLANGAGNMGLSVAERALNAAVEGRGLSGGLKNTVFNAYIATNPLRQLIIQPAQAVRTMAYNPTGWVTGSVETLVGSYFAELAGLSSHLNARGLAFNKFIRDTGLMEAVEYHNLVRGSLIMAADRSNKLVNGTKQAAAFGRRIGFDMGESANIMVHAAAVYDRLERLGANLADKAVRDEAHSQIRALAYDMNRAGDMPYNNNSMAFLTQFMQMPHKAFLQYSNRRLDSASKVRLILGDLALYGPPMGLAGYLLNGDILPDDPDQQAWFKEGLLGIVYNHSLNYFTSGDDKKVDIDFSALNPYDTQGWVKALTAFGSGGITAVIQNSPAGALLGKDGSRLSNAVHTMGRYFNITQDDDQTPETFLSTMNDVAKLSSGWNNALKAKLMLETQQRMDQYGNVIEDKTGKVEAIAQLFGFQSTDVANYYDISKSWSGDLKNHKEDTLKAYNGIKRMYAEKLELPSSDPKFITAVSGFAMKAFKNDPEALAVIQKQMKMDMMGKDNSLAQLMVRRAGIDTGQSMRDQIKTMPIDDATKAKMNQVVTDTENARKHLEETNKGK